jgi:hypothetical protein
MELGRLFDRLTIDLFRRTAAQHFLTDSRGIQADLITNPYEAAKGIAPRGQPSASGFGDKIRPGKILNRQGQYRAPQRLFRFRHHQTPLLCGRPIFEIWRRDVFVRFNVTRRAACSPNDEPFHRVVASPADAVDRAYRRAKSEEHHDDTGSTLGTFTVIEIFYQHSNTCFRLLCNPYAKTNVGKNGKKAFLSL